MESKEYQTLKARMAYREKLETIIKCNQCPSCIVVRGRSGKRVRICKEQKQIVDNRITTIPRWCPREE